MSRRYLVPLFVVTLILLPSLLVWAADPDPTTCLDLTGKCYVSNTIHPGTDSSIKNGTAKSPWVIGNTNDDNATKPYRDAVAKAVWDGDYDQGILAVIVCDAGKCATTWYKYFIDDEGNNATTFWRIPKEPPEVGVKLPFSYILGGGAFLGVLLIGSGVIVHLRARRKGS